MTDLILTREEHIRIQMHRARMSYAALRRRLEAAGKQVSRSTLYAALNRASSLRISKATRERVLTAVEEALEMTDE